MFQQLLCSYTRPDGIAVFRAKVFFFLDTVACFCEVQLKSPHRLQGQSLDGSFRACISLGAATSVEQEGRDMGRVREMMFSTGQKSQPSSTSVQRRPLGSEGGVCEEHWCAHCSQRCETLASCEKVTDIVAKMRERWDRA